jgi:hypothetical protein
MKNNEKKQEFKGGMLLYPRSYHINEENPDLSYCYGLNEYGKDVIFYLNPTEQARESARKSSTGQTVPNFEEFADEDRRATKQCNSNPDNSPAKPFGILMMEQASPKEDGIISDEYSGFPIYEAKWASILREGDYMDLPPIGFGYMEIGFNPRVNGEVDDLRLQYKQVEQDLSMGQMSEVDAEEKKENLYLQITQKRQKWFIAVILKHKQQATLPNNSKEEFSGYLSSYLSKYTDNGMYGGAMIRVRRGDIVDSNLSCYCNMSYDYKKYVIKDVNNVIDDWFKFNGNRILKAIAQEPSIQVDIIPTQRINFGKMSVDKYSKDLALMSSKIMKTYVDKIAHFKPNVDFFKDKVFLVSKVSVRLAKVKRGASKGGFLASTIHSFSSPLGNIFSIDNKGEMAYKMDFAKENSKEYAKEN